MFYTSSTNRHIFFWTDIGLPEGLSSLQNSDQQNKCYQMSTRQWWTMRWIVQQIRGVFFYFFGKYVLFAPIYINFFGRNNICMNVWMWPKSLLIQEKNISEQFCNNFSLKRLKKNVTHVCSLAWSPGWTLSGQRSPSVILEGSCMCSWFFFCSCCARWWSAGGCV